MLDGSLCGGPVVVGMDKDDLSSLLVGPTERAMLELLSTEKRVAGLTGVCAVRSGWGWQVGVFWSAQGRAVTRAPDDGTSEPRHKKTATTTKESTEAGNPEPFGRMKEEKAEVGGHP